MVRFDQPLDRNKVMHDLIQTLNEYHIFWILLALGAVLILIDYFFPTDWPAFVGYACFSAAIFFAVGLLVIPSLIVAIVTFVLLLLLHRFLFSRFLTNAPGKNSWDRDGDGIPDANEEV